MRLRWGDNRRRCRWLSYAFVVAVALVATAQKSRPLAPALLGQIEPSRVASPAGSPVPPSVVPASALPIAGWIVDGIGQPIAGVRVTLREPSGGAPDGIAETGVDGEFRLAPRAAAGATLLLDAAHVFPAQVPWLAGPAPRIMLARRAMLEARVVVGGVPVADAEVRITDGSQPTLAIAHTDGEGHVKFTDLAPGPYEVWATHRASASSLVRIADVLGRQTTELVLEPAGSVRGQVTADGPLPAGSTVQLTPLDVDHAVRIATLDERGRFAIEGVPRGRWRIETAIAGYLQAAEQAVRVMADESVVVRLERAGTVSGTVVDAAGSPVANAAIVVRHQRGGTAAASAASSSRSIASGGLRWVYPLAAQRLIPTNEAARFGATRPGSRPAECGHGHCGIDLVMPRGSVVLATADGEVVAAYTEIRGEAGRFVAIDHGDGLKTLYMHLDEVRAGLEPGQKIRAGDPVGKLGSTGFAIGPAHLHFAVTQDRNDRTWYLDPEPMLRHAVVLAEPKTQDAVIVATSTPRTKLAAAVPVQSLVTDAHGVFHISGVEPGAYVAVAFASGLAPGASDEFTVKTGSDTKDIVVTLHPGVTVRGRVVDRNGPINGATVLAAAGFGETASKVAMAYTDAHGEFVLRSLAGKLTLTVTAASYGEASRTIAVDPQDRGRARPREDFTLTIEDAQLRGQVRSPDGVVAGASVRIIDGPTRRTTVTDATGQFTIGRVATGHYVIELASPSYPTKRFAFDSDRWQEVRLDQGGGVRCIVLDSRSGAPLAGVRVDASGPDGITASRTTDARGGIELRGLVAGAWKLSAAASGYAPFSQQFEIRASRVLPDLRIDLQRGARLAGVVRDGRGTRMAGVRVTLGTASTQTDADGNFQLIDVASGAGVVEAVLGDRRGALAVQLAPGDERNALTVELAD